MEKNRRNRKHRNNWNNQRNNQNENKNQPQKKVFQFNKNRYEDREAESFRQKSIVELKARETICPMCGQAITDIASAIDDKKSGKPAHFECVLKDVSAGEKLGENEKIAYIGHGRFGVLYFENPRDQRKFTIKKVIEVENKEERAEWRNEISGLYSQVQ